jgi:hypothetical protein
VDVQEVGAPVALFDFDDFAFAAGELDSPSALELRFSRYHWKLRLLLDDFSFIRMDV